MAIAVCCGVPWAWRRAPRADRGGLDSPPFHRRSPEPAPPTATSTPTTPPPTTATPTTIRTVTSDACRSRTRWQPSPAPFSTGSVATAPTTTAPVASWDEHIADRGNLPAGRGSRPSVRASLSSLIVPTDQGPWVLQRIDIDRATTEIGPHLLGRLPGGGGGVSLDLVRADHSPATASVPLLCQVDPTSLAVVRQIQLPPTASLLPRDPCRTTYLLSVAKVPVPHVWVGYGQTLAHIATGDGALLSSVPIASGTVASLSVDPGCVSYMSPCRIPLWRARPSTRRCSSSTPAPVRLLAGTPARPAP